MDKDGQNIVSDLQFIKGIGPGRAKALSKQGINTKRDLLLYFPKRYIDRYAVADVKALRIKLSQENLFDKNSITTPIYAKNEVTLILKVSDKKERKFGRNRKMLELILEDDSGRVSIIFWNYIDYFNKIFEIGDNLVVSGTAELDKYNKVTFTHPEIDKFDEEEERIYRDGGILPVYVMGQYLKIAKISMKILRNAIKVLIEQELKNLKESFPTYLLEKFKLPDVQSAVKNLHFPKNRELIQESTLRFKFEEAFLFELFLVLKNRGTKQKEAGVLIDPKSKNARKLYDNLPFELTRDQKKVIREISIDFQSGQPMNRLLQGDVGSGKTIVSLLAMLMSVENGFQAAIVAPTEILAEQHYHTIKKFLDDLDVKVVQLVGGMKKRARNNVLEDISSGEANIIVGTHALFESDIPYNKLGFVIIDEQHRFGVSQRAKLKELAKNSFEGDEISPHILVMSATPIPRTLSMTVYGDLDVSFIKTKPKNRKDIKTKVVFESSLYQVHSFIKSEVKKGHQAYIVYPLVEKSEKLEYKAATEQYEKIKSEIFPDLRCGLLHGQMFWYEKEEVMNDFLNKKYDVLVATTVIEVGIDIPNATIMLIENAEKFGLSQLHQLRGRTGRGESQSYCFLATKDNYQYALRKSSNPDGERKALFIRLKTMEETNDGFKIAEEDLKLRGPGDVIGTRQSGLPSFKHLDLVNDGEIITMARKEAKEVIKADPHLRDMKNKSLRMKMIRMFKSENNFFDIA